MAKRFLLPLAFTALLLAPSGLRGDTVILKSGEKIEGTVLSETETDLTLSIQVTPTIKDERVLKKADIDRIEKVKADEVAWAVLAPLDTGSDSLEREDYQRVVAALTNFLSGYPESPHVAVAKERLRKFEDEQRRVDEGQMKMDGEWLSKERVQEEQVQIGGRILFNRMKRFAAAGHLAEAMGVFDVIEKSFGGSADYPNAVTLAKKILPTLKTGAEQGIALLKRRAEQNKVRLQTAKGTELDQLKALLAREKANTDAAVAAIEKSGVKWLPLQPATERSLTALLSRVSSEESRLRGVQIDKMTASVKAAETAETELRNHNLAAAETALNEATTQWPANEVAIRLKKKVAAIKAEKAAEKSQQPKNPPAPKAKGLGGGSAGLRMTEDHHAAGASRA